MNLLREVASILQARDVPHALIGAAAMAVHGVARSTFDLDLLVVDRSILDGRVWETVRHGGSAVDVRIGDAEDPLAGVVRFDRPGDRSLDIVVGRSGWQARAIERASRATFGNLEISVVSAPDLILLKLYAAGPQDAWDIEQLLCAGDRGALTAAVEKEVSQLPEDSNALWRRIVSP